MTSHIYEVLLQLSVVLGFLSVSKSINVKLAQRVADLRDRSISTRSFSSLRRVVTSARGVSLSSDGQERLKLTVEDTDESSLRAYCQVKLKQEI